MSILKRLSMFRNNHTRNEQIEKLKDELYECYYTNAAKNHLNVILETYNRQTQSSFEKSLNNVKSIGLYEPCADSINYLKHMRWVSMKARRY